MEGWVLSRLALSGVDEKERALSPSCEEARLSPQDRIECERVS